MNFWLPQGTKYVLVTILSSLMAIIWLLVFAYFDKAPDAGRGGALSIIVSFYLFFAGNNISSKAFAITTKGVTDTAVILAKLIDKIDTESDLVKNQSFWLVISSIIGTFCWGFGDWIAIFLRALFVTPVAMHCCPC